MRSIANAVEPETAHASMDFKIHRPRAWVNAHVAIDRECRRDARVSVTAWTTFADGRRRRRTTDGVVRIGNDHRRGHPTRGMHVSDARGAALSARDAES
jgi:hypothetical protein